MVHSGAPQIWSAQHHHLDGNLLHRFAGNATRALWIMPEIVHPYYPGLGSSCKAQRVNTVSILQAAFPSAINGYHIAAPIAVSVSQTLKPCPAESGLIAMCFEFAQSCIS
jgi:hypothetical protein